MSGCNNNSSVLSSNDNRGPDGRESQADDWQQQHDLQQTLLFVLPLMKKILNCGVNCNYNFAGKEVELVASSTPSPETILPVGTNVEQANILLHSNPADHRTNLPIGGRLA
uniref:uncharacterized protein isoform X4 n=1 Tax=Myxine glutinosa TaxID=7769 RepID=UPI00358E67B3